MFAAASERLGRDLDAPPLPERGPAEVTRAARAFNEMQARLQRMVRQRTQMLAAMSHDLRTPLTRLRLRAELMDDPAQQQKTLADLDQIEDLIGTSLEFARDAFTGEAPARLDLAALVRTICDEAADAGGRIRYHGPERAPFAARQMALRRALANLVDNAMRHGEEVDVGLAVHGNGVRARAPRSWSRTMARACRKASSARWASPSTGPMPHAAATAAGPGSGLRSSARWRWRTAAGSR